MKKDFVCQENFGHKMWGGKYHARHKIQCPVLVLWGDKSHVERYFNPREAWPRYASNIAEMITIPSDHYP